MNITHTHAFKLTKAYTCFVSYTSLQTIFISNINAIVCVSVFILILLFCVYIRNYYGLPYGQDNIHPLYIT